MKEAFEQGAKEDFCQFHKENSERLRGQLSLFNKEVKLANSPTLKRSFSYFSDINGGGKLLRGTLVSLGHQMTGCKNGASYSDDLAVTIEVFQSSVLLHDDVLDRAKVRRGKETAQVRLEKDFRSYNQIVAENPTFLQDMGNANAISLGYLGLYLANERLVSSYGEDPCFPRLLREYDDIMAKTLQGGIVDMMMPYLERYQNGSRDSYLKSEEDCSNDIAYLKTANYTTIGPLVMGMVLNGTEESQLDEVRSAMRDAGIAFQIQDDIFGIFADEKILGKDICSDVSEYKTTLLYLYIKENCPELYEELLQYYGRSNLTGEDMCRVREIFREGGALRYATDVMNNYFTSSKEKVLNLTFVSPEAKRVLLGFIVYLEERSY